MKKILVLGANGMVGHVISIYLIEKGYNVFTFTRRPFQFGENILGDAKDLIGLRNLLLSSNFDFVINCIGVLNEDASLHKSDAVFLNSFLPHYISEILSERNTKLIHLSTDCVFSGKNPPYYESSFPDGETFYDRTKAMGEVVDRNNLTFRNSIIGPDIRPSGIGLFNWFMKQSGDIVGYGAVKWTGVTTVVLARAVEEAIRQNLSGIYNLVNNEYITKLDLLLLFNRYFNRSNVSIIPSYNIVSEKILKCSRTDFLFVVPSYESMISEMYEWVYMHKDLYYKYLSNK